MKMLTRRSIALRWIRCSGPLQRGHVFTDIKPPPRRLFFATELFVRRLGLLDERLNNHPIRLSVVVMVPNL